MPLNPLHEVHAGSTHVLPGNFYRSRNGRAGCYPCQLVTFDLGDYHRVEVGEIFDGQIFQPRMSGINALTKSQREELADNLKTLGVGYDRF